jgi:hypothetical protein
VRQALIKRAPLLLLLLGVLFVWQGGFGLWPVERAITWRLWGAYGSIRRVDIQVYDGSQLLSRTQLEYPNGVMMDPTTKVSLKQGHYQAKVFVWRAGSESPEVHSEDVTVDANSRLLTVP